MKINKINCIFFYEKTFCDQNSFLILKFCVEEKEEGKNDTKKNGDEETQTQTVTKLINLKWLQT